MIDRFLVITLGLLVAALPFAAWIAADWYKVAPLLRREYWRRLRREVAVGWGQMDDESRAVMTWMGRAAWLWVLLAAAL